MRLGLVGAGFTEEGGNLGVVSEEGPGQWSPTATSGLVHLRLRVQEDPHYLQVPIGGGPVQWSLTVTIGLVHIGTSIDETFRHLQVPET